MLIPAQRQFERKYYLGMGAVFLALVLWVFGKTFYLRPIFTPVPLALLLQIHGAVMTGWALLLVVQASLISLRKIAWHRQLGWIGVGWAGLVVLMGSITTLHAAAREVQNHSRFAPVQVLVTTLELVQMVLFAGLVTAAVLWRRRTDYHKRLMLLTIICMLPSILARLPGGFMTNSLILTGLYGTTLAMIALDTWRHRRLHPAFGWGGVLVLGALHLTFVAAQNAAWLKFASGLVSRLPV
jgi:hypothetical protein